MCIFTAGCGGELNAEYGKLRATAYDAYYSNGRKCEWKIIVTQRRKVTLILHTVNLSSSHSCTYGNIKVMTIYIDLSAGYYASAFDKIKHWLLQQ